MPTTDEAADKPLEDKPEEALPAEKPIETPAEKPVVEKPKEPTIAETMETKPDEKPEDKGNLIPEAAFLEEKKGRKAAEKRVKDLEDQIKGGATSAEVSDDVKAIAAEFGVDEKFLTKLTQSIETRVKKDADARVDAATKPIKDREKAAEIDKRFTGAFNKAMEAMPEYKDIVNADVIKALSLDPKNANKTFPQLIEETYGKAITGKRTIETTTARGGKEPGEIDYDRAQRDPKYFAEIMADPDSKKEYNKGFAERISKAL